MTAGTFAAVRITIIAPPWVPVPPPAYGGTEAVLDALARGLQAAGHDVLLVTTGDSTCPVETSWILPEAAGIGVAGSAIELRHVIHGYQAALEWDADLVHDHTLIGPFYSARYGLPVVTTNHGPFEGELGDLYAALGPAVRIIAISHHQASTAGSTPVAAVIHHGVDLDAHPVGLGRGGYAAFLGRMTSEKGVHVAARLAHEAGVALKIAAKLREPHERAYFDARVRPLLHGGVEYVGELGPAEKVQLLGGATCLLNPIRWPEPFGMVMVESLACGTPVVTTPRGAAPEIVEDWRTGFVRSTEVALVAALHSVDRLERRDCRAAVEARFTSGRMVADHVALYEEAVRTVSPVRAA